MDNDNTCNTEPVISEPEIAVTDSSLSSTPVYAEDDSWSEEYVMEDAPDHAENLTDGANFSSSQSSQSSEGGNNPSVPLSTQLTMPMIASWVTDRLQKHTSEIKHVVTLPYNAFIQSIKEINTPPLKFHDSHGKELRFGVKKGSHSTIFWKLTVRIHCHKVNSRTGMVESSRLLNMKQYIHLYNEIVRLRTYGNLNHDPSSSGQSCSPSDLTASTVMDISPMTKRTLSEEDECCICMERKAQIILKCAHKYCEQCIDQWNCSNKSCPVCRAPVKSPGDSWVLTDRPDGSDMMYENPDYLMSLAEHSGVPDPALGS